MKTISAEQQKNTKVLEQLQEYAQLYFDAIIEANTTDGECKLKIGKYSARELVRMEPDYELPRDTMFDEDITIKEGSFQCTIQYRQIFYILAKWEQMMQAGKQKAVFEVGESEEKSAKVLLPETTPTGRYKEKRVRMQRITGNWWASRKADRDGKFALYYELNGVIFITRYWYGDPQSESAKEWCAEYGDAEIKKIVISFIANNSESKYYGYFSEVARRANIKEDAEPATTATETPKISEETAGAVVPAEDDNREIITAKYLYWDHTTQTIKTKVDELVKVTEHLYYKDAGTDYVTIVRHLNGVFWEQQCNAEVHRSAFNSTLPEYEKILKELNAYQTVNCFLSKYQKYSNNGWYVNIFQIELARRISTQTATIPHDPRGPYIRGG